MGCTASSSASVVASQETSQQQQKEGLRLRALQVPKVAAEDEEESAREIAGSKPEPSSMPLPGSTAALTATAPATATHEEETVTTTTQHEDVGVSDSKRYSKKDGHGNDYGNDDDSKGEGAEEFGVLAQQQQAAGVINGVLSKTPSPRPVPGPLNLQLSGHTNSSMPLPEAAPKTTSPSSPGFFMHSRSVDDYHKTSFFAENEDAAPGCDTTSSISNHTWGSTEDGHEREPSGHAPAVSSSMDSNHDEDDDDNSIGSMPPRESALTLLVEDMDNTIQSSAQTNTISPQDAASKAATLQTMSEMDSGRLTPTVPAPRRTSLSNALHAQRYEQARVMADLMHEGSERTDARIMEEWDTMRRSIGDRIQMTENKRRQSSHATLLLNRKAASPKDADQDSTSDTLQSITSSIGNMDSERAGCSELFNALNAGIIRPYIHDTEYMLLIDAREKAAFDSAHIVTAQHKDMINPFIPYSEYSLLIVYDDDGSKTGPGAQLCDQIRGSAVPHVTLLSGGFAKFSKRYPFISRATNTSMFMSLADREALQHYPSEIRVQRIFLGNFLHAHAEQVLQHLGITHILNATTEHENKFPNAIIYCSVRVSDVPEEDVLRHFERAADFIRSAVQSGGRVLVHCTMGVSRSTTLLVAYFVKYKRWSIKDALEFISDRRQGVKPNRSFLKQLSSWEETILGSKITDTDMLYF